MSKKEKREKDQEKDLPQQEETACKDDTEKKEPAAEAEDQAAKEEEAKNDPLEELQQELSKQKDLLLRTAAEYENFRKRTEKEKRAIYADATAEAVKAILPIADSLEYAVKAQDGATAEYQKGLEMIQSQFNAALEKLGVSPVGEAGEEFNPEFHNAVAHVEDESVAENTIVEVFQKGYMLKEKVIRHAMVKVAN